MNEKTLTDLMVDSENLKKKLEKIELKEKNLIEEKIKINEELKIVLKEISNRVTNELKQIK